MAYINTARKQNFRQYSGKIFNAVTIRLAKQTCENVQTQNKKVEWPQVHSANKLCKCKGKEEKILSAPKFNQIVPNL